ncbi:uncharacterized protein BX663DRAFT_31037 [Cokeromyces recurvatus]|uniref:uncharacterized protein n=1 Tax=Cokeromyces recurvatus TaxID=90255 RepID=UPI00221FA6E5|nr:uncharacterized protein BX663DRAFT_31037 [Cokeromyces recurvatus]KAI7903468.1 hypothetical protein BX663DRAFT_31037 [Cokeromyces recurvatus]
MDDVFWPPGSVLPIPLTQQQQQTNSSLQPQLPPRQFEQPFSPPAQAHDYDYSKVTTKGNRAVIPSKRAAQNRAAQKAFRQRREQYIKDLEAKAKLIDTWQEELLALRNENKELRERVSLLESRIVILAKGEIDKIPEMSNNNSNNNSNSHNSNTPKKVPIPVSPATIMRKNSIEQSISVNHNENNSMSSNKRSHSHDSPRIIPHELSDSEDKNNLGPKQSMPLRRSEQTELESSSSYPINDHDSIGNDSLRQHEDNKKRKIVDNTLNLGETTTTTTPMDQVSTSNNKTSINTTVIQNSNNNAILLPIQEPLQYPPNPYWTNNSNDPNNNNSITDINQVPAMGGPSDFDLDFDFDPFFEEDFGPTIANNNEFLPNANSGQVLDDLFAMLQTRQRPQIPMIPIEENSGLLTNNTGN